MISLKYVLSAPKNLGAGAPSAMRKHKRFEVIMTPAKCSQTAKQMLCMDGNAVHHAQYGFDGYYAF